MAARRGSASPWPTPTQHAYPNPLKSKRKLWDSTRDPPPPDPRRHRPSPRQAADSAAATSNNCGFVANNLISCFPTANSTVIQNIPTRFVWNTNLPQFSQSNLVDIFLIHGDTDVLVQNWTSVAYQMGHLPVTPDDPWWGARGPLIQPGQNQTLNFYFLMVAHGSNTLLGTPQATFTATQTSLPTSILSSLSASAASASSVSAAAAAASANSSSSSASAASSRAAATSGPASLQSSSSSSSGFPNWAIALLSVFGFLAFLSLIFVFWILVRNLRRRRSNNGASKLNGNKALEHRGSVGSQSPMMANIAGAPHSPTTVNHEHGGGGGGPNSTESHLAPLPPVPTIAFGGSGRVVSSDGASTISRADSTGGPFSAIDAAAMAAAFRNVMRKPDFADRPMEEGEISETAALVKDDVMNQELAEEGRDIRSVSSSRGVKVETLSDEGAGEPRFRGYHEE